MKTLQKKLLVYITIISFIPMLLSGFFYYRGAADKTIERITRESQMTLELLDNDINVKTGRLQNAVDILFNDYELQKLIRDLNLSNPNENKNEKVELDLILEKIFKIERELETVVIFLNSGGSHVAGKSLDENKPFRFMMQYGMLDETPGVISWLGAKTGISGGTENKNVVAGVILRDNSYLKDQQYMASIYLIFSSGFFERGESVSLRNPIDIEEIENNYTQQGEKVYVYDSAVKLLYQSHGANGDNILMNIPLDDVKEMYSEKEGCREVNVGGERMMLVFYTSPTNGWKLVRTIPYSEYGYLFVEIVWITVLALLFIFAAWCTLNYFTVRKITMPLKAVAQAMKQVGDESIDVSLTINSKDEIGIISTQFNAMIARIKELLLRVRQEEQRRKKSDILMLEYQINPHFLYNTLAAIRLEAIIHKQDRIAQMLLLLAQFLRNTVVNCTKMISIEDEIKNINNYILLLQIRYNNQINTEIEMDKKVSDCIIPGMLVQPIIENAVLHGLNDKFDSDESAELKVNIKEHEGNMIVSVFDNGCGLDADEIVKIKEGIAKEVADEEEHSGHIGLRNIQRRITMMFGADYGVSIKSEKGKFTEVNIKLPIMKKETE